jgi:membrane associated rhomboid family serine protease/TPR repeat protein
MARRRGAAEVEKGAVTPNADTELAHAASPWRVHFLFGQGGSWGEPKSQWKWIGKGELSADQDSLKIVGQRHRYFWFPAKQVIRVELQQVCNVVAAGRLVKFEVKLASLEAGRIEIVRLRTSDAQTAQVIALALPTTRSAEFERAHHEKLSFDRSMEQLGTQPIVTWALVAANIAWFLFVASQGGGWLAPQPGVIIHWGSNFGPLTLNGEWWRLFTCMFVHFGLLHLTFNMWVLWSIGRMIERMFGSLHYALLYVLAGLCGSMASLWWQPNVHSAGASGAIFGLLGGLLAFILNPVSGVPPTIAASQRRIGFAFIAYNLIGGFTHHGIDNAAHLGGLVGGFVMGWMLARPLDVTAREQAHPRFALAAVLGLAALVTLGWHLAQQPHLSPDVAFQQSTSSTRIDFYPGRYRRVVLDSGEKVSAAMQAVHAAADATSLNTAIAVVQQMAGVGNAEAAFRLGRYYHLESSEPDYALALKYYQVAYGENHAWATNNLGLLYRDGLGMPQNKDMAYEYFQKAAGQHNPWAYLNLADTAFSSGGKNAANKGIEWLEEGGRNQCTLCLIEQAAIYHSGGYGMARDSGKTLSLLNKAAALGDTQATLIVAELHLIGDGVPQSSKTSFEMLKTLSDNGDGYASTLLGELSSDDKIRNYLFESALGGTSHIPADLAATIPQDTSKAIHYWERASQQGSCQSWIDLSSVYDRGIDVNADSRRGADNVERAVRCDPSNSFYLWKFATRFRDAKGRDRDCQTAAKLYKESLDHGYADAAVDLGYIYDKGCAPIVQDDHRALQTYLLGAKLGVALCENNVGAMIKHGRGIEAADLARGYGWIKLAAMHGNDLAKANLQDPLFTASVRAAGLAQLVDIQRRLLTVPRDAQSIQRDPWY